MTHSWHLKFYIKQCGLPQPGLPALSRSLFVKLQVYVQQKDFCPLFVRLAAIFPPALKCRFVWCKQKHSWTLISCTFYSFRSFFQFPCQFALSWSISFKTIFLSIFIRTLSTRMKIGSNHDFNTILMRIQSFRGTVGIK